MFFINFLKVVIAIDAPLATRNELVFNRNCPRAVPCFYLDNVFLSIRRFRLFLVDTWHEEEV